MGRDDEFGRGRGQELGEPERFGAYEGRFGGEHRFGLGDPRTGTWSEPRRPRIGRGPKNYRRSDERIREDVNDILSDHDWLDASEVEIAVSGGEVTITGFVPDRASKRLVEDLTEQVRGIKDIHNQLRLVTTRSPSGGAASS